MQLHVARCYFATTLLLSITLCVNARGDFIQVCRRRAFLLDGQPLKFGYQESFQNSWKNCVVHLHGGANDTLDDDIHRDVSNSNESIKRRPFLSLLRPRASELPSDTASPIKKKIDPNKIPHGPTGGGYAATRSSSSFDIGEDNEDVLTMSNRNPEAKLASNPSYQSAFALKQGQTISLMRETLPSKDEDKISQIIKNKSNIDNNEKNMTIVSNGSEVVEMSPTVNIDETNETHIIVQSNNNASKNEKIEFQAGNASIINASVSSRPNSNGDKPDYTSSGYVSCGFGSMTFSSFHHLISSFNLFQQWVGVDFVSSFGLSSIRDDLKISKVLRPVRKAAAQATGLHGFLSGKPMLPRDPIGDQQSKRQPTVISIDEELGIHDSTASEAIVTARELAKPLTRRQQRRIERRATNQNRRAGRWGLRRGINPKVDPEYIVIPVRVLNESPDAVERRRRKRVEEIDSLLKRGSARLMELQCEKDDLQQAPNPLFNYTKQYDESANKTFGDVRTTREFNFPPQVLVEDYIDELVSSGRLICLNHTDLWQNQPDDDLDDDEIGDDLFTPSADARKLYQNVDQPDRKHPKSATHLQNSGGGSWLLRTGFGNGGSLGEKLGETIETQAYKAVTASVMMVLARILSALHGINVMNHSDIRLYVEDDPDLPPIDKKFGSMGRENYAQQAIKTVIEKGAKKKRKHGSKSSTHSSSRHHGHELSDAAFIQRDAVVETLISHCQISAPLLKLFPLDWQRAIVGNIITLVTAIISDFADGIQLQILGHSLSFSFKPITEADLFQHLGSGGFRQNHRRSKPDEFEYAVWATAHDINQSLTFLGDGWLGWFEKRVGGGIVISQLSNLIARVVLTLIDEVLSGARLDLWSSQANGPRLYAAMEYRTTNVTSK